MGIDDRARVDAGPLRRRMLTLPELGQARIVEVGLVGNDAGTTNERRLRHVRPDDHTGCTRPFKQRTKLRMAEKTDLSWPGEFERGKALDDLCGFSVQLAAQPVGDVV